MQQKVKIWPQCIFSTVFPGLQSISIQEIMERFPIVENLITVVYDVEKDTEQASSKQQQESSSCTDGPQPLAVWLCLADAETLSAP